MTNPQLAATAPQSVVHDIRQEQALSLRIAGANYRAIAQQLGVSVSTAYRYVADALEETNAQVEEKAAQARTLELARLDDLWLKLSAKAKIGAREIDTMIRISERRAKLLGMDAPSRSEWSGPGGGPVALSGQIDLTLAPVDLLRQLDQLYERIAAAVAGGGQGKPRLTSGQERPMLPGQPEPGAPDETPPIAGQ